ncbi:MAG: TRAP transporter small permease [Paracoccus sp. (in: a-proteobacteria)]
MQETLSRFLSVVTFAEKVIAFLSLILIAGVLAADVIMRELFHIGLFGSLRIGVYALILCAMAGFGVATASGEHLRPTFADALVPAAMIRPAQRLGQLASCAIMVVLVWASWKMVVFIRDIGERDMALDLPVWIIQLALPLAFGIAAIRYLSYAIFPDLIPEEKGSVE